MSDGENRRVGADADGQRQYRGRREQRIATEQPRRMPHVALRVEEPDERARIALPLLRLLDTAERAFRCEMGFLCCHAATGELVLNQRQVRSHFPCELVLRLFVTEEGCEPPPESSPRGHH